MKSSAIWRLCQNERREFSSLLKNIKEGASKPVSRILFSAKGRNGDHSSSPTIARGVQRPTRGSWRDGQPLPSYLVLLRVGFTMPPVSPPGRCALTLIPGDPGPHLFTLTAPDRPKAPARRYIFCGTFRTRGVPPDESGIPLGPSPLASTLPCGVRTFLSPAPASPDEVHRSARARQRSPGLLAQVL